MTAEAPIASGAEHPVETATREGRRLPLAGLARLAAIVALILIGWSQSADFVGVLSLAAIWGVAVVGLALVLGAAGQISLCQASFVLIGAYLYGAVTTVWHEPTGLGLLAAIAGGGIGAVAISPVLLTRGYYLALATIAVSLLVSQIATSASWIPGGLAGLSSIPSLKLGPLTINSELQYLVFTAVILILIIGAIHLRYGRGWRRRAIQTLHHDADLLAGSGQNPGLLKLGLFVLAGALAGLAGGLYAGSYGFMSPDGFDYTTSFALALAVMIGGSGRLTGALLGALVYQLSLTILPASLADYRFALLGIIVVATIHWFPSGLLPARKNFEGWLPAVRMPGFRRHIGVAVSQRSDRDGSGSGLGVELVGVTKQFGGLRAVNDLSARIAAGRITALIGPNGAGKTTLLDLIAGDQTLSAGRIVIDETDVGWSNRPARARLGIARTYQRVRLVPSLTVLDNALVGVDQAARVAGGPMHEMQRVAQAMAALEEVGLAHRANDSVHVLAFGQRRLLEMARAIASKPRLLLLDEPSSGLNQDEAGEFADVIRRVAQSGCTIVLVEHNLPFVRSLAHTTIALDLGRLLADGETEEVFELPSFQAAYVGGVEGAVVQERSR